MPSHWEASSTKSKLAIGMDQTLFHMSFGASLMWWGRRFVVEAFFVLLRPTRWFTDYGCIFVLLLVAIILLLLCSYTQGSRRRSLPGQQLYWNLHIY